MVTEAATKSEIDEIEQRAREERRKARATWPERKLTLEELDEEDDEYLDADPITKANMMWRVTQDAWSVLFARTKPRFPRRAVRVVRRRR